MADPFVDAFNRAGEGAEPWRWALRAPPAQASALLLAIPAAMAPPPELGEGARALQALARGLPPAEDAQGVLARQASRRLKHDRWPVAALAWSPDGRQLTTAGGRALQLWDAASGSCLRTMKPAAGRLNAVAWSPDGRLLAGWIERVSEELGYGNGISLWDAAEGSCLHTLSDAARPWTLRWLEDGQRLAYATTRNAIQVWNASTNACTTILQGHPWQEDHLAWSPDGRCLASIARDGTIALWDLVSGVRAQALQSHGQRISACAWSPDGRSFAAGGEQTLQLWDASTGVRTHTLRGHGAMITALAWSPDGRALASASTDQTIRLWDRARGECRQILEGHQQMVHGIAFSADGRCLASTSADRTIRLWDGTSGVCTHRLHHRSEAPSPIAWSPEGRTLAVCNGDHWIQLWRRDIHELAALFEIPLSRLDPHHLDLVASFQHTWPAQDTVVLPWLRFISAVGSVIRRFDVDVAEATSADDASAYAVILDG